ncbi:MAG: DegV family protein [Coriobacteriia bacterium]|nr:DegV family protein [Coriobacteriia bacterium]MCL2750890.1 DegV family protein [Coriobacteriia bacterium]
MEPFSIFVDTSCDLPQEYLEEHGIEVLPIPFSLNEVEHKGGYWQEISSKDYYDALRNGGEAKTSLINSSVFAQCFTELAEQGKSALFIILSAPLSATYQSALVALEQVKQQHPDCQIYPIDSISATVLNSLLAQQAVKKRAEGLSAEQTAAWLEEKKHTLLGFFTVDDLMYLHRGGRLSMISAVSGSLLKIKPVLNLQPDGTLALKDKTRGREAALKLLVDRFMKGISPDATVETVVISHADCEDDALRLSELVREAVKVNEVQITLIGPVIGAHVGPGTVALGFEANMTREEYEARFYQ